MANSAATHIRVLAGPGTGKTYGLQQRVLRLLQDGVGTDDILAVTFTRAAATSLKNDLGGVGIEAARLIEATTLHSLSFRHLMRQNTLSITRRVPRPVLDFERATLLSDLPDILAGENYSGSRRKERAIIAFESAWAQLQHEEPGWPPLEHQRLFHDALIRWLQFHRAMLIGEVIPTMLAYLRNNPDVGPRFPHVLVDEYQDLNRAEQVLIDQLAQNGSQLVIGDDDQSIYKFKHAHPEGIIEYPNRFPGTLSLETEVCRRCPPMIVDMANALMTHQVGRLTNRTLVCADPERPQDVAIVRWPSIDAEATGIAKFVDEYLRRNPEIEPGRVLILAPRRHLGYKVRDALTALHRESRSYFQEQELDDRAAQRALTLLRLLVDPTDRVSIRWWVGQRGNKWNASGYARVRAHCERSGIAPHEALDALASGELELRYCGEIVSLWRELRSELARLDGQLGVALIDALVPEGNEGTELLRASALAVASEDTPPSTLLDDLSEMIRGPEVPQESEVVRVMSLHKSKGLTADVVVIAGMTEGLIPFVTGDTDAEQAVQLEEQRRLFYVALTRSRRALILSSGRSMPTEFARRMGMFPIPAGMFYQGVASRFIDEISPPGPRPVTPEQFAAQFGY
jgi:DNA helicase II / ATP-dependent DNA helicase PcrA